MARKVPAEVDAEGYIALNDAVKWVMKATGRTRRQAEQAILQKLKSGEMRAEAEVVMVNPRTGEECNLGVQEVPADVFAEIPSEH